MTFQNILVATDFDDPSRAAVEQAVDLASRYGASLTVVHTFESPDGYVPALLGDVMKELQDAALTELGEVVRPLKARVPRVNGVVRAGKAWEQILEVAREARADLIVVGSHGRKHLQRALLGSVAERVVRMAPVPVLTVHTPVQAAA
jgi:nucleotide-binding universal stress UspA family protein